MTLTCQRFLLLAGLLLVSQAALALAVGMPLLLDAGYEAMHDLAQLCRHPFRAHYLRLTAAAAVPVAALALVITARFALGCWAALRRTRVAVAALLSAAVVEGGVAQTVAARLGVASAVDVRAAPAPIALCYGLWRPRIYLSASLCALLSEAELAAVLHHEDHHRRRREPLRLLLLAGVGRGWRRWPAFVAAARIEMEVAADRAAVDRIGSPRPLARALLKVLQHPAAPTIGTETSLILSPLSATAVRIDCLAGDAACPPLSWRYGAGLGVAVLVVSGSLGALALASDLHPVLHACQ